MIEKLKNGWGFWAAGGVILLVTLILGVRTQKTIAAVLSTREQILPGLEWNGNGKPAGFADYERRQLALRQMETSGRDPFNLTPAAPPPAPPVRREPAAPPPWASIPSLHAMMFDGDNSTAQIRIGERMSDWLRVGDEWRGWRIMKIEKDWIKVARGDEIYVMRAY
jgi:hypothetical protein